MTLSRRKNFQRAGEEEIVYGNFYEFVAVSLNAGNKARSLS